MLTIAALAEPISHGLSQKAVELGRPLGFPITNSMVVTWIVARMRTRSSPSSYSSSETATACGTSPRALASTASRTYSRAK